MEGIANQHGTAAKGVTLRAALFFAVAAVALDVTGSFIAGVGIGAVLRADSITEKTVAFAIGGLGLSAVLGADVGAEEAVAITALLMGVITGAGIN